MLLGILPTHRNLLTPIADDGDANGKGDDGGDGDDDDGIVVAVSDGEMRDIDCT